MKTRTTLKLAMAALIALMLIGVQVPAQVFAGNEFQLTKTEDNSGPAWSHDGSRLVFRKANGGNGNIWTIKNDGTDEKQITNFNSSMGAWGATYQPPKDEKIYYLRENGYWWVGSISSDGSAINDSLMLVPGGEPFTPPSFSEDGSRFCYVHASYNESWVREARREIKIANADGSNVRTVIRDDALRHYSGIVWGKGTSTNRVAYSKAVNGVQCIFTIDTDGSNVTQITDPSLGDCEVTDFVSDKIFFTNKNQVSYVNVQTKKITQITNDAYENGGAVLSSDAKKIAYHSKRNDVYNIYITSDPDSATEPSASCKAFQLTKIGNSGGPAWSPDGSKMVFERWDDSTGNVWTINSDGSNEKMLTSYSNNRGGWYIGVWWAAFRPNSNQIYYLEDSRGTLWWIRWASADGSSWDNEVEYVPGGDGFTSPSFSEDGSQFCYIHYSYNESGVRGARREIKLANADGSNIRILMRDDTLSDSNYLARGKGTSKNKMAYAKRDNGISCIFTIDTDGSNVTQITDASVGDCVVSDFVGDKIFFSNKNQVSYVNIQTKKITQITNDAYENGGAVLFT